MNNETIVLQSPGAPDLLLTAAPAVMITLDGGLRGAPGKDGANGAPGTPGKDGKDGAGIRTGGTTGQVLAKKTDQDHDTEWITVAGGGLGASADSPYEDLYVNPTTNLSAYRDTLPDGLVKTRMTWVTDRPSAFWSGIEWDPEAELLGDVVADASAIAKTAQVVLYSIPHRDGGGYSTGGADSVAEYNAWIAKVSAKIGQARVIIILEPDAVGQIDLMATTMDQEDRYDMISDAISTFKVNNPNARVYIDAGNPSWHTVQTISDRLSLANIDMADGIALNVSNFQSNAANITYGQAILQDLGVLGSDKGFVIDSSRNGNPVQEGTFNPPNRQFGHDPMFGSTGIAGLHGWLWIKAPGDSDGASTYIAFDGSTATAPEAGSTFPLYLHNPDVADYTNSPNLGQGAGMTQRQPVTSLIPYNYINILAAQKADTASPTLTGAPEVNNPTTPAFLKLQGLADAFNVGGLEIWNADGTTKWQLTQAADGTFKISHFDGDWSVPLEIAANDNVTMTTVKITGGAPGAGKVLTSDADGDATWQTPAAGGGGTAEKVENVSLTDTLYEILALYRNSVKMGRIDSNGNGLRVQAQAGTLQLRGTGNSGITVDAAGDAAVAGNVTAPKVIAGIDTADAGTTIKFQGITMEATGAGTGTVNIPFTNTTHTMVLATATQTLTNKKVTPRNTVIAGTTATLTPNGDTSDQFTMTGLTVNTTIQAPSGTPTHGQKLLIRIKDNGTARTIGWDAIYRPIGCTLPTTTVVGKQVYVGCVYNSTDLKWDVIAVAQEA